MDPAPTTVVLHSEHVSLVDDHLTTVLTQHGTVVRAQRCVTATVVAVLQGGHAWTRSVCRVRRARTTHERTGSPQDAPSLVPDLGTTVAS